MNINPNYYEYLARIDAESAKRIATRRVANRTCARCATPTQRKRVVCDQCLAEGWHWCWQCGACWHSTATTKRGWYCPECYRAYQREYARRKYHTDAEYRAVNHARSQRYHQLRYHQDPAFRARKIASVKRYWQRRYANDPVFRAEQQARLRMLKERTRTKRHPPAKEEQADGV